MKPPRARGAARCPT